MNAVFNFPTDEGAASRKCKPSRFYLTVGMCTGFASNKSKNAILAKHDLKNFLPL